MCRGKSHDQKWYEEKGLHFICVQLDSYTLNLFLQIHPHDRFGEIMQQNLKVGDEIVSCPSMHQHGTWNEPYIYPGMVWDEVQDESSSLHRAEDVLSWA